MSGLPLLIPSREPTYEEASLWWGSRYYSNTVPSPPTPGFSPFWLVPMPMNIPGLHSGSKARAVFHMKAWLLGGESSQTIVERFSPPDFVLPFSQVTCDARVTCASNESTNLSYPRGPLNLVFRSDETWASLQALKMGMLMSAPRDALVATYERGSGSGSGSESESSEGADGALTYIQMEEVALVLVCSVCEVKGEGVSRCERERGCSGFSRSERERGCAGFFCPEHAHCDPAACDSFEGKGECEVCFVRCNPKKCCDMAAGWCSKECQKIAYRRHKSKCASKKKGK